MQGRLLKSAASPRLTVRVTQKHIDEALRCDGWKCMIEEAVISAFPRATHARADVQSIRFSDLIKGLKYKYFTPLRAAKAIYDWDKGIDPKPFSFRLESAQVREGGWLGQRSRESSRKNRKRNMASVMEQSNVKRQPFNPRYRKFGMCLMDKPAKAAEA